MVKRYVKEYFHPDRQALDLEVREHPELIAILGSLQEEQGIDGSEFEIRLAAIATYCKVVLDGEYLPSELDKLCGVLMKKLREKRVVIFN